MEKKLEVKDLRISFKTPNGKLQAVRDISFDLYRGETLCIVGESGSGKSVTAKSLLGILPKNVLVEGGEIFFDGKDLLRCTEEDFYSIRGDKISMIFQDPMSSLNPIMRIGKQLTEAMLLKGKAHRRSARKSYKHTLKQLRKAMIEAITHGGFEKLIGALPVPVRSASEISEMCKNFGEDIFPYAEIAVRYSSAVHGEKKRLVLELTEKYLEKNTVDIKELAKAVKASIDPLEIKKDSIAYTFGRGDTALIKRLDSHYKKLISAEKATDPVKKTAELIAFLQKNAEDSRKKVSKADAKARALKLMEEVGIGDAKKRFSQYPFEFSGGMRQRIVIAIALAADPDILVCDEPTTALDVTIQAQILELINKIKEERRLSVIFITHDLGVVANMADRIAVMYAGKIVEYGTSADIFYSPAHPYTWALLSSMPDLDTDERLEAIPGTPPNMIYPPVGDAFAGRNKYALKIDYEQEPPMFKISDTHSAATWLLHPKAPRVEPPSIIKERALKMKMRSSE